MAAKTSEWRPGPTVCRCCLAEGCYKDISTEYFWMGKREVYAEMLSDTLNVSIAYSQSGGPNSNSRLICEPCISRLRDASDFRRQVLECEKTFMNHLDPGSSSVQKEVQLSLEEVKIERVKQEKKGVSDDEDFDDRVDFIVDNDDDDDDLDDEPLMKLATKVPKKEVDLLDLLDSTQITVKRKSTAKTKAPPAKKAKSLPTVKPSASKPSASAPKAEKKKKDDTADTPKTSIWQMTVAERRNAATFIQYTTVMPFIFMGFSFKCFYCLQYYQDLPTFLDHTSSHAACDRLTILTKYLPKGKRTLQADISNLKCNICNKKFLDLNSIKQHLEEEHGKTFYGNSNGMIEFNLEIIDGMLICHLCGKKFHSFSLLSSHMNTHVQKVVCENCGAGFLTQHLLRKHKETHFIMTYNCKECNRVFYKKSQLRYHKEKLHQGKQVKASKCPLCFETFKEHYNKMVHMKEAHGISGSFQCHMCKITFSIKRRLTEHIAKSHTEKYKCEICLKCFGMEYRLKQHMNSHTGEKKYACHICKNVYVHKVTLAKHMKKHNTLQYESS